MISRFDETIECGGVAARLGGRSSWMAARGRSRPLSARVSMDQHDAALDAYHQGTVWPWLTGHFIDAWLRVHEDKRAARRMLQGFPDHLAAAGVGSISEIFDAEPPYLPRGCIAQAWSIAEILRAWLTTEA
jgi:glycogen debranching enzyme